MKNRQFNLGITILMILTLIINSNISTAQTQSAKSSSISGRVIDGKNNEPLIGATVIIKETTQGDVSNLGGEFKVSFPTGTKSIVLVVNYIGYESMEIPYDVNEINGRLKEDIILMGNNLILDEVKVVGDAATAIIKGDTIQFNSGAFKTNPDATAEDLLAKMPGFEVEDGKIKSQGENVTRVYVDGKSFYKNDPSAALNALPADLVESIQLFDEKSEKSMFTGADDGSRTSTINIVTKAKNSDMKMGDFIGGYGLDNKYNGKANVNIFEGNNRFSIGLGANNINQSALSGSKFYGRHGVTGIQESLGLKLNYSGEYKTKQGDKTELGASYVFDKKDTDSQSEKIQQSLFNDEIYNVINSNNSSKESHTFNLDLKSTFGTNMIIFEPYASVNSNDSHIINDTERYTGDFVSNKSNTATNNSSNSYNVGGKLEWMKRLGDKSSIAIGSNLDFSRSESDQLLIGNSAQYNFDLDQLVDSIINQNKEVYTGNNKATGFIDYSYKIKPGQNISAAYQLSYDWSNSDNQVYLLDPTTNEYTDIYENLSNVFERDYLKNSGGIKYSAYEKDKYKFNIGVNYQHSALQNNLVFPEDKTFDYTFNSMRINANLEYYFSQSKRLSLTYKGLPNLPSLGQLQDVVDNSNPLMVTKGNPFLDQSFTNSISARYYSSNVAKSTNFSIFATATQESNSFSNSIEKIKSDTLVNGVPIQAGSQISSTVNLDNKLNAFMGMHYSFPVNFISSKMNIGGFYRYSRTPSIYNGVERYTDNNSVTSTLSLHSNISESVDFSVSNMATYTQATNSNSLEESNKYLTNRTSVSFNWLFLNNFVFNTNYSYNYNHYFDNGSSIPTENNQFHLLNAGIGYKFMDRNAEVRLSGFDLLNQSQSIVRSVGEQFVTDNITNVLQRYFMVTFSFKFNSAKNTVAANKGQKRGPQYGSGPIPGGHDRGHGGGFGGGFKH